MGMTGFDFLEEEKEKQVVNDSMVSLKNICQVYKC